MRPPDTQHTHFTHGTPMARIVLITGGARSGKSRHAQECCEQRPGPHLFVATCQPGDDEMRDRVRRHRAQRDGELWDTVEEPTDLTSVLGHNKSYRTVLVDCLTLWVSNLLGGNPELSEEAVQERCIGIVRACRERQGAVLLVTNEVGDGIVPDNSTARRYRDLVGRCNQTLGRRADALTLVTCGVPMDIR